MAAYAAQSDLAEVCAAVAAMGTQPERDAALERASRIADDYIRAAYVVPLLAPIPAALTFHVASIAARNHFRSKGKNPAEDAYGVELGFAEGMKWLREVAAKKIPLAVTEGGASVDGATVTSQPERGWSTGASEVCIREDRGW